MTRLYSLGAIIALAVACGGRSERRGPADEVDSIPLDDLVPPFASAICEKMERCVSPRAWDDVPGGCAADYARQLANQTHAQLVLGVAEGTIRYDSSAMAVCLAREASQACDDSDVVPECEDAIRGLLPSGTECRFDLECADGDCVGCRCVPRLELGSPCGGSQLCPYGSSCSAGICAAWAKRGETCGGSGASSVDCGGGLACDAEPDSFGTCRPVEFVPAGSACDEWRGVFCEDGSDCMEEAGEWRCLAESPSGGRCSAWSYDDSCPADERCAVESTSTCQPLPGVGQPCDASSRCRHGAYCAAEGTCREHVDIGEACRDDDDCYSAFCSNGVCSIFMDCRNPTR